MAIFWLIWIRGTGYAVLERKLLDLLTSFRHTLATRARDHVFALLGLANDGADPIFDPKYDQPHEDIELRYAFSFVAQGKGAELLAMAGISSQAAYFPSWIPIGRWWLLWNRLPQKHPLQKYMMPATERHWWSNALPISPQSGLEDMLLTLLHVLDSLIEVIQLQSPQRGLWSLSSID
jgi:hypothetical protein